MNQHKTSPKVRRKLLLSRALSVWPFLVWFFVSLLAIWAYRNSNRTMAFTGRVEQETLVISSSTDAVVTALEVEAGEIVSPGQLLVQLDNPNIDLEIEELTIEIQQDHRERERRYLEARHRLITQSQDLQIRQSEDQALLGVLGEEDNLLEDLYSRRIISRDNYVTNLATVETLRSSLEIYPGLIEELEQELNLLESSKSIWDIDNLAALVDSDKRLQLLRDQKSDLEVRAVRPGAVSEIFINPGETALAGTPILKLVLEGATRIVAFIPESESTPPNPDDSLFMTTQSLNGTWLTATVTHLAPNVTMVPDQLSPLPDKLITGRYCYLELAEPARLVSGESVALSRRKPGFFDFLNKWKDIDRLSVANTSPAEVDPRASSE